MKYILLFLFGLIPFLGMSQAIERFGARLIITDAQLIGGSDDFYIDGTLRHPRATYVGDSVQVNDIIVDADCNVFTVDSILSVISNFITVRVTPADTTVNTVREATGGILRAHAPPSSMYTLPANVPIEILDCFINYITANLITYDFGDGLTLTGDVVDLGGSFDSEILINSAGNDSFNITTNGFVELDVNGLRVHDGASTGSIFFNPNSTINTKITTSGGLNLHTTGGGGAKINFYRGATEFGNMNEDDGLRIDRITSYSTTGPPELYLYGWNTISGPGGRVTLHGGSGSASNANAGNVSLVGGHVDTSFQVDYSGVPGAVVIWSYSDTTVSGVVPALYTSAVFPGGVYAGMVSLSGSHNPTADVDIAGDLRIRENPVELRAYVVMSDADGYISMIDTATFFALTGGGAADGNGIISALPSGNVNIDANQNDLVIDSMNNMLLQATFGIDTIIGLAFAPSAGGVELGVSGGGNFSGMGISTTTVTFEADTLDATGVITFIGFPAGADGNGIFDAANEGDTTAIAEMYLGGPLTIYGLNNVLTIDSLSEAVIAIDNALDTRSVLAMSEIETRISFVNTDVSMNSHLLLNSTQNSLYFNDSSDSTNTEISNDANSVTLYAQSVPDSILSSTNLTPSYMQMYATSPTSTGMTYISPGLHRSYQTTGNDISRVELFNNYITYLILDSGVDTMNVYFTPTGLGIKDVTPTSTLDINGTLAVQEVTQNDTLTKIAALDYSSGRLHWVDASTLGGSGGGLEGAGTAHQVAVWIEPDSLHSYSSFTYNGTNLIGSVPGYVLFNGDVQASIYSDSGNVILTSHVQEASMTSSIQIADNFIVLDADSIQIIGGIFSASPDSLIGIQGSLLTRTAISDLNVSSIYSMLPNQNVTIDPNNNDLQIGTAAANNTGEFEFYALTAESQDVTIYAGSRDSSTVVAGEGFYFDAFLSSFGAQDGIVGVNYDYIGDIYNFAAFGDSMMLSAYPGSELNLFFPTLPRDAQDTISGIFVWDWATGQTYIRDASTLGGGPSQPGFEQDSIAAGATTYAFDLESLGEKVFYIDMTSANATITLSVTNHSDPGNTVTTVFTTHFRESSGTDPITWPANFYDMQGTALGTDNLTTGTKYTCYYQPILDRWYCN